jgi:hypothetical protein
VGICARTRRLHSEKRTRGYTIDIGDESDEYMDYDSQSDFYEDADGDEDGE